MLPKLQIGTSLLCILLLGRRARALGNNLREQLVFLVGQRWHPSGSNLTLGASSDSGDDFIWVCVPGERLGIMVCLRDETVDGGLAAINRLESNGNSGSHAPDLHATIRTGIPSRIQMFQFHPLGQLRASKSESF